jgi:hypothetical protein
MLLVGAVGIEPNDLSGGKGALSRWDKIIYWQLQTSPETDHLAIEGAAPVRHRLTGTERERAALNVDEKP